MPYTPHQKAMIQLALRLSANDPLKIRQALLTAMAVESNFRNLNYGDRDSQGVLQQRPSTGWGPPGNAQQDIIQFLTRARRLGNFQGSAGALAQAIQRSAFPSRYDQRLKQANELLASSGQISPGLPLSPASPVETSLTSGDRVAQLEALRGALGKGPLALLAALKGSGGLQGATASPAVRALPVASQGGAGGFNPAELFYDPLGGFKFGRQIGAIGGHSDHVHAAFQDPQQMRRAIALARSLGLAVRENPAVDRVDPVHVRGSFHYRTFPGMNLGEAIDVSGNPAKMAQFYRSLAPRTPVRKKRA